MTTTTRFTSDGSFTVPAFVTTVDVRVVGAGSQRGFITSGANGAAVSGTVAVTAGDVLAAIVGKKGVGAAAGYPDSPASSGAFSGGGSSKLTLNGSMLAIGGGAGAGGASDSSTANPDPTYGMGGNGGYPAGAPGVNSRGGGSAGTGATQSSNGTSRTGTYTATGGGGLHIGGSGAGYAPPFEMGGGGGGSSGYSGSLTSVVAESNTAASNTGDGYVEITYTVPPSVPTILSPVSGATVAVQDPVPFAWRHNSPDTQAKANVQIRPSGGSATDYPVAGDTQTLAHTLTAGLWEWRSVTYAPGDVVGPYSAWIAFTVAVRPDVPVITTPTNGGTITDATGLISWTAPLQNVWQSRIQYGGVTAWTSGEQPGPAKSVTGSYPINSAVAVAQVAVKYNNIWSGWASSSQTVAWVGPDAPEPFANSDPENGCIHIGWVQPVGATMPVRYVIAVTENGVRKTVDSNVDPADREFTYWTPLSGVPTAIHVIAYAASGAFTEGTTGWSD